MGENLSTRDGAGLLPPPTAELARPRADLAGSPKPKRPTTKNVRTSGRDPRPPEMRTDAAALHVLLIEDEFPVAESLRRQLEFEGFRVDVAPDGESGLALARTGSYDIILLDRRLRPGMSGDQLLEHLHRDGNLTPVLILTGYPDVDSAFQAGRLRASGYLQKGQLSGAELAAAVRKAVATGVQPSPTVPFLFSTNSGRTSDASAGLATYLRPGQSIDRSGLIRALAIVLVAPDPTLEEFVAAANGLRLIHEKEHLPFTVIGSTIRTWVQRASSPATIGPLHVSALQRRLAPTMRRAALELMTSREYVSQIAYGVGYSDHPNFDHDFREFFGMTPRAFRQLL